MIHFRIFLINLLLRWGHLLLCSQFAHQQGNIEKYKHGFEKGRCCRKRKAERAYRGTKAGNQRSLRSLRYRWIRIARKLRTWFGKSVALQQAHCNNIKVYSCRISNIGKKRPKVLSALKISIVCRIRPVPEIVIWCGWRPVVLASFPEKIRPRNMPARCFSQKSRNFDSRCVWSVSLSGGCTGWIYRSEAVVFIFQVCVTMVSFVKWMFSICFTGS